MTALSRFLLSDGVNVGVYGCSSPYVPCDRLATNSVVVPPLAEGQLGKAPAISVTLFRISGVEYGWMDLSFATPVPELF